MDDRYLDPLIGFLLPGVGDFAMSMVGLWVVGLAARKKVPAILLARMLLNLGVDALVGVIPVAGDVFDVAWKANKRNVALLRTHAESPRRSTLVDWLFVAGAGVLLVAALAIPILALGWIFRHLFH
jgi:hypothetical protein